MFKPLPVSARIAGDALSDKMPIFRFQDADQDEIDFHIVSEKMIIHVKPKQMGYIGPLIFLLPIRMNNIIGPPIVKETHCPEGTQYYITELIIDELAQKEYQIMIGYPEAAGR